MGGTGTVSQFAIRAVVEALAAARIDSAACLRAVGIAPELAVAVDARFPIDRALALWDRAADVLADPAFGIHTAARLPEGYGLMDYLVVTSPTLREGYARLAAFVRIAYDESELRVLADDGSLRLVRAAAQHGRHYDEFVAGFLVQCGRRATGRDLAPRRVAFPHAEPADTRPHAALFRCPLEWHAPAIVVELARADGELPSLRADSPLHEVLEDYARTLLARLPDPRDLAASIRAALVGTLPRDLPTLERVARDLKMSPRSLQRRLRDRGTTFLAIVDDVRKELALEYLANAALSIGEVTYLLHFSEVAAFARAFKRWMKLTPAEYRARLFARA